jgi:hypothetical protein
MTWGEIKNYAVILNMTIEQSIADCFQINRGDVGILIRFECV